MKKIKNQQDMKQTAVEYIIEQLYAPCRGIPSHIIEKAKEMEKERMFEVYHEYQDYLDNEFKNQCGGQSVILTFEEYYNETFNTNEK
jgi:hypothetical protein